ncbi:MAG: hypothetical protein ACI92W_001625 [Paraglaciecola sp.]|jgi:hypothetical protein
MIPAYLVIFITGWRVAAVKNGNPSRLTFLRVSGYIILILLIALGWLLPMLLPVFSLPASSGDYSVGTRMIYHQSDRDEIITEDPDDKREFTYKIWYPSDADISRLKAEKYIDKGSRSDFATKYGLLGSALNYLDSVSTYAYENVEVAKGPFPVLIFSHGYGSKATGYYSLLTELASQGYIIVNMNHTYESLGTTFPDGRIKYFDYQFQQKISADSWGVMQPLVDAFANDRTYEERHPI